jgi:hypothetical protein
MRKERLKAELIFHKMTLWDLTLCEAFWDRETELSIVSGGILSRAHGNFGQQSGILESFIVIINCYILL